MGGHAAGGLAALGRNPIVISVLFDDAGTVAFGPDGLVPTMAPGAVHVAMETISPALSRELADIHAGRGQLHLAAPVFGRPEAASKGDLAIMCSGPDDLYRRSAPMLAPAGTTR